MRSTSWAAAFALGVLMAASPVQAGELRITIRNLPADQGRLMVALYDSAAGYKTERRFRGLILPARKGTVQADFTDLPPGRYGIVVFHDLNENGMLDTNLFGVPTEPFGFGNNAMGTAGPPSFDATTVQVGTGVSETSLSLRQ